MVKKIDIPKESCSCMRDPAWDAVVGRMASEAMEKFSDARKDLCPIGTLELLKHFLRMTCAPLADVQFLRDLADELEADIKTSVN